MDKAAKASLEQKKTSGKKSEDIQEIQEVEKRIDEELDQSFPASDPPSYSQQEIMILNIMNRKHNK